MRVLQYLRVFGQEQTIMHSRGCDDKAVGGVVVEAAPNTNRD